MDNTDDKEDECQKQEKTTTLKPKEEEEEEEEQKEVDVENTFFVFQPRTVPDVLSSMIAWYVLECCSVAKDAAFARLLVACLLGCLLGAPISSHQTLVRFDSLFGSGRPRCVHSLVRAYLHMCACVRVCVVPTIGIEADCKTWPWW